MPAIAPPISNNGQTFFKARARVFIAPDKIAVAPAVEISAPARTASASALCCFTAAEITC